MQVTETLHDGLKRGYVITVPAAQLTALRDARLAEIARGVPVAGYRRGEAPWPVILQRFGAAVLGEVLEQEVAAAVRRLVADRALRPARAPSVDVGSFTEGSDLTIGIALEVMPEVPLPDLAGLRLERLRAEPGPAQLRQALARLAARHGTLVEETPRPAAPGEILVCDAEGGLPADLLVNGVGLGARAGSPGLPPANWSIDLSPGLQGEILATGIEDGLPCLDLRLRGVTTPGAFLRIFPAMPKGLAATPGQVLTLCMRARLLGGTLPEGSSVQLGFNARSADAFLRGQRQPAVLGRAEMRAAIPMIDDPALAFARPVLDIGFRRDLDLDLTLRIGPARVFAGAEEPEALLFNGGSFTGWAIEVGGPGPIPGFSAQFEGLAPGQTRVVEVVLPADQQAAGELANRRARYVVTARALQCRRPLTDADALACAVGLADGAALEAAVMRTLRRDYDARSRQRLKAALLDALAAAVAFPVPDSLVVVEFEQVWQRRQAERRAGRDDPADAGKDDAALRAEYRAIAERRIRLRLLMDELARAHGLQVSEAETAEAIRRDAARYPGQERQVFDFYRGNAQALDALRAPLLEEKVIDFLVARAGVSERLVSPEELGAG
ncbi:MAG TPA: trigger factor [Roseomonas sp.]|nr:trigger factor [Roseomonas sp.]